MRGKIVALLLTTLILCAGCSESAPQSSGVAGSVPISSAGEVENEQSVTSSQESEKSAESKYYFANGVLLAEDVKIEITDYKIIEVGDEGNEYGETPVIAFWYKTTNLSGKEGISAMIAWIAMFEAIQDNDPNMVNALEVAALPDNRYLDTQTADIKKDGTVECAVAYELNDMTTPVILKANRGVGGETLGEQIFEIA
ncbi:DUF5067 domain-containing protein [Anaerotruncus sp. AF02-27]|uniref:DUF5067 domain-containing protein n=1 Tax=Anaerotruncus TaxID=244127 RepID=UPI000E546801|nr:DUF5067 domain-containing protein [Anaerotruncus sp. AF02-27]RGX53599.1 DUF5067 domain-containing protein [Anaerotruncus sp. AF02-27]